MRNIRTMRIGVGGEGWGHCGHDHQKTNGLSSVVACPNKMVGWKPQRLVVVPECVGAAWRRRQTRERFIHLYLTSNMSDVLERYSCLKNSSVEAAGPINYVH